MRTTSPWPAPSVARGVDPSELAGSHTTPSGIAVTTSGRVSDPASVDTVSSAPSATPTRVGRGRREPGDRGAGGGREVGVALLQQAAVEQLAPGGEHGLAGAGCGDGLGGGDARGLGALAVPRAERGELGAQRGDVAAAEADDVELVGDHRQHAGVGQRERGREDLGELARAALPVDERADLLGDRGHREHDVGALR